MHLIVTASLTKGKPELNPTQNLENQAIYTPYKGFKQILHLYKGTEHTVPLQLAGWLTDYLTKCQPDPPPGRDILWPCVILLQLWVRLTFGQMYPQAETSCDQV